jgi:hypothetical protein
MTRREYYEGAHQSADLVKFLDGLLGLGGGGLITLKSISPIYEVLFVVEANDTCILICTE